MGRILQYKQDNFVQHSIEQFVKDNSQVDKKRIIPKPPIGKNETNWRRNEKNGQLSAVQERPQAELSSSSSNSSAGSQESEMSKQGFCDPGSSSDGSDELEGSRDLSEVSLYRLL